MEVSPTDNTNNATVGRFMVDIGFKGWRGIWVSYDQCKESESLSNKSIIETVDFVLNHQDTIYIDSLEFVPALPFSLAIKLFHHLLNLAQSIIIGIHGRKVITGVNSF